MLITIEGTCSNFSELQQTLPCRIYRSDITEKHWAYSTCVTVLMDATAWGQIQEKGLAFEKYLSE